MLEFIILLCLLHNPKFLEQLFTEFKSEHQTPYLRYEFTEDINRLFEMSKRNN